jgi:UDP-N-acetylglucosamine 1-carboxyvinyltransferase
VSQRIVPLSPRIVRETFSLAPFPTDPPPFSPAPPVNAKNAAHHGPTVADAKPFHWEYVPEPVPREVFRIDGGVPLDGTVPISGAKNAALKLLAAATLTGERCRFTNVPEIEDVRVMTETLRDLGVLVDHPAPNVYEVASGDVEWLFVPLEAAAKMRASFILLGPLLARFGRVIISNPGGDRIGRRPVDLHVEAMRVLGAEIEYRNGYYFATAPGRLHGGEVRFPLVSVMGTENAMLAATLADGHTVIRPAAQEPEVDDLIVFLQKMGADVQRTYADTIEVHGRRRLRGADHALIPDRIEAGTFVVAAAVTRGRLRLEGAPCDHLGSFLDVLRETGLSVECRDDVIEVDASGLGPGELKACAVETAPYPGLATDLQPPSCVLLSQASGRSMVHETIFEDRLEWLSELRRMGARAEVIDNHHAVIEGPAKLCGAEVEIGDLRAGASLILAALAADGVSTIHGAHHVHRGYENIERKFLDVGARIERLAEPPQGEPAVST